MGRAPAFQFYADDFLAGTCDMSPTEVGVYITFLCVSWSKGFLPNDERRLFLIARTKNEPNNEAECEAAVRWVIANKFVLGSDGNYRNSRLEAVRKESESWREKSELGGKVSGAKRLGNSEWGKEMAKRRKANQPKNEPSNEPFNEPTTNTPSPTPSPIKTHTPAQSEAETERPEPNLQLPLKAQSERNREWLGKWQEARKQKHGSRMSEISWEAESMTFAHWSEQKWYDALVFSARKASLSILDPDNDFQRLRAKRAPQTQPEAEPKRLTPISDLLKGADQ